MLHTDLKARHSRHFRLSPESVEAVSQGPLPQRGLRAPEEWDRDSSLIQNALCGQSMGQNGSCGATSSFYDGFTGLLAQKCGCTHHAACASGSSADALFLQLR